MASNAIKISSLSKRYRIENSSGDRATTLAEAILQSFRASFRRQTKSDFFALKDIDLEIKKGEVLGIIGRNGAGKSTLLKILSRITEPTSGKVELFGRVGSLLEVGTGFHPELSGRENIFLNGSILGMNRSEIRRQFDEIVDFAGVSKFLDAPVKRYSSGMYVRLAFAVAAHLNPEILIVDEVLAVGDAEFQQKCGTKMKQIGTEGRTVILVSHNMAAIASLCSNAICLSAGSIVDHGKPATVIHNYMATSGHESNRDWRYQGESPTGYWIDAISQRVEGVQPEMRLEFMISICSNSEDLSGVMVAIDIADIAGQVIMQALPSNAPQYGKGRRQTELRIGVTLPPLIPGTYECTFWIGRHYNGTEHVVKNATSFRIDQSPTPFRVQTHGVDHGWIVPGSHAEESEF